VQQPGFNVASSASAPAFGASPFGALAAAAPHEQDVPMQKRQLDSPTSVEMSYLEPHHASAPVPAGAPAQQPGGFAFGASAGITAGGSASLPSFSTTAFGAGATPHTGATFGAPQTGSMTLGAAPGEAGAAPRRKVKLRRPGRK
jgi:hypothetical protein